MIIDVHNHIVAGNELQNFQAGLINSAGFHRPAGTVVTEESIQKAKWRGHKHSKNFAPSAACRNAAAQM